MYSPIMGLLLWQEFFEDLEKVRGRSRHTILAYRRDLDLWDAYRSQSSHIPGFAKFLEEKGLSVRSAARVLSSVRTYLRFLESKGFEAPELREVHPPEVKIPTPEPLEPTEFQKLLEAAQGQTPARTLRNRLTLSALFKWGARVSELIELNLQDVDTHLFNVRVTGTYKRVRCLDHDESLNLLIREYLVSARPELIKRETSSLLINDRGDRPSRVDIWRWLDAWSEAAGFDDTIHPHRFRHGCAAQLLLQGKSLHEIKEFLGHAHINSTQIYTKFPHYRGPEIRETSETAETPQESPESP